MDFPSRRKGKDRPAPEPGTGEEPAEEAPSKADRRPGRPDDPDLDMIGDEFDAFNFSSDSREEPFKMPTGSLTAAYEEALARTPVARDKSQPRRRDGRTPPPQAVAPSEAKKSGETVSRLLWAIPLVAFAITVIVSGGIVFTAAMVMFALIGMSELYRMTADAAPLSPVGYAAGASMIVAAHFGDEFHMVLAGVAFLPVMFGFAAARTNREGITVAMAITVFGIIWIGLPFAHAVLLLDLPVHGQALLVDVLVATFMTDTAAYAGGRALGRRKLAPSISPNKSVEGAIAGFLGGILGFWVAGLYQDWLPGTDALIMGAVIGIIAPLGDLFASMMKRDLGIKDTGTIFGPHGGVLDRLDAVLFTVVTGYYLVLAFGGGDQLMSFRPPL